MLCSHTTTPSPRRRVVGAVQCGPSRFGGSLVFTPFPFPFRCSLPSNLSTLACVLPSACRGPRRQGSQDCRKSNVGLRTHSTGTLYQSHLLYLLFSFPCVSLAVFCSIAQLASRFSVCLYCCCYLPEVVNYVLVDRVVLSPYLVPPECVYVIAST